MTTVSGPPAPRVSPRRLLMLLAAAAATLAIAMPGGLADPMHRFLLRNATQNGLDLVRRSSLVYFPGLLYPFLALLSDRVRLGGTRHLSWLLLATAAAATLWLALVIVPIRFEALLAVHLPLSLAMILLRATEEGLAVDIGRKLGVPGTVSVVRVVAAQTAILLLAISRPIFRHHHRVWGGLFAFLVLLAFSFIAARALRDAPVSRSSASRRAFRTLFGSRSFWLSGLLLFLLAFALSSLEKYLQMRLTLHQGGFPEGKSLRGMPLAVALLGGFAYLFLSRRYALRGLLLAAVGLTTTAIAFLFAASREPLAFVADSRAILVGLTVFPLIDLALRAAPQGLEAFSVSLFSMASNFGYTGANALALPTASSELAPTTVLLVCLAVSLSGLIVVYLLPSALVGWKNGELQPEPAS